jgi:hypothetical protein
VVSVKDREVWEGCGEEGRQHKGWSRETLYSDVAHRRGVIQSFQGYGMGWYSMAMSMSCKESRDVTRSEFGYG